MLNRDYEGQNCSIARALEVVGERWTLLIIRDVLLGLRRFDQLQESLGIARNVLTDRLNRLVDEGVLERVLYSERPERYEYQLTKKGLDLQIALTALRQWGDDYLSDKPPRLLRRKLDKTPVVAALVRRAPGRYGPTRSKTVDGPAPQVALAAPASTDTQTTHESPEWPRRPSSRGFVKQLSQGLDRPPRQLSRARTCCRRSRLLAGRCRPGSATPWRRWWSASASSPR
jgi:DNA-binding HxlR family transcriptional regulator